MATKICRSFCDKQFCIITFSRIFYSLTGKLNFDIDFFKVLISYNFYNLRFMGKSHENTW